MNISVIIPVYNAARYVEQAVRSAVAQPEVGQVVLVEDGSTDGSLAVCERLAAELPGVELRRHPEGANRGAAETRNVGVRAARAGFVAFLDADDYYLPGRFEPACRVFAEQPEADGVYDAVGTHFENDKMRAWWREQGRHELSTLRAHVEPEQLFETLLRGGLGSFHTNGIVVRRGLFERTGPFDAELRMSQDFCMWIKMAAVGRLVPGRLDRPVAMRRLHGENRIVRHGEEHRMYGHLMCRALAAWAPAAGLPRARRRLLVRAVMESWLRLPPQRRVQVSGHASPVRFLAGLAGREPWLVATRRYWRQVGRALGGSRLRSMLRRNWSDAKTTTLPGF